MEMSLGKPKPFRRPYIVMTPCYCSDVLYTLSLAVTGRNTTFLIFLLCHTAEL